MNCKPMHPTPWDTVAFNMPTWEMTEYSEDAFHGLAAKSGHFTVKVDPLADKRLLQDNGFYYCDTLLEPYCCANRLRARIHPEATVSKSVEINKILAICDGAFSHGRFHRDFNLSKEAANLRYRNWLKQLADAQQVFGLYWEGDTAGFIAYNGNNLVLHAVDEIYRGRGLAKHWWSAVCNEILSSGNHEVVSSISAANLAALNLYTALGFSFRNALDVYHKTSKLPHSSH